MTENYQDLLGVVGKMVAHPHSTVVSHDRERAARILLALASSLSEGGQSESFSPDSVLSFLSEAFTSEERKFVFPPSAYPSLYKGGKWCYNNRVPPGES